MRKFLVIISKNSFLFIYHFLYLAEFFLNLSFNIFAFALSFQVSIADDFTGDFFDFTFDLMHFAFRIVSVS